MSTSKHIDKICLAVVAGMLAITVLFMCGGAIGIQIASRVVKYQSTLFDTSYVHTIDIVMNDWDSFIESCENEEYSACTVVIDGEKHSNIAIRAKGNTSLSSVKNLGSERYSFKLEFDHYEDAKTLDGLDKLCLNNLIQDNTMMKDYIVYQMMADFGVDTPLCSFAYLTVNGEDWGLYLAVEGVEDSFLDRNYGSNSGDLYKPDSMSFGGGRGNGKEFNMDDFDFDQSDADNQQNQQNADSQQNSDNQQNTENQQNQQNQQGTMPTPPTGDDNANAQGGMTPPTGDSEGNGFGGGVFGGQMPDMGDFDPSDFDGQMPDMGDFDPSDFDGEIPEMPDGEVPEMGDFDPTQNGGGFGSGMDSRGSDDVKLKYIDDDADSYSNIFDNAKTDVTTADENRLINALKNLTEYTDLENTLDMDEVLRYFVVHNFVVNGDSYTGSMIHNYYLHESDGKLGMIPWDYNLAFGTFQGGNASTSVNADIDNPVSGDVDDRPMVGWIFSDEEYTAEYHELFAEFISEWFDDGKLSSLIEDTAEMIRPYVEKDPTKFCTLDDFDEGVEAMVQFVTLRAEAVANQLAGDDTAVETDGLDISAMGTMGNTVGAVGGMGGKSANPNGTEDINGEQPSTDETPTTDEQPSTDEQPTANEKPTGDEQSPENGGGQSGGGQAPENGGGQFGGGQAPENGGGQFGGGQPPENGGGGNGGQPPDAPSGGM